MKGGKQPPEGRKLPIRSGDSWEAACATELSAALCRGMAAQRAQAKTVMRWTGAGERTVKAWRSGASIPRGDHLIALMRHSDEMCAVVLGLSRRFGGDGAANVMEWRNLLAAIVASMDQAMRERRQG